MCFGWDPRSEGASGADAPAAASATTEGVGADVGTFETFPDEVSPRNQIVIQAMARAQRQVAPESVGGRMAKGGQGRKLTLVTTGT